MVRLHLISEIRLTTTAGEVLNLQIKIEKVFVIIAIIIPIIFMLRLIVETFYAGMIFLGIISVIVVIGVGLFILLRRK
ncbi:MAG: hypothetical protein ABIH76_01840 [Candidatus Bathyarchaeota archaeon]